MTSIEKKILIVVVILIIFVTFNVFKLFRTVEEAGGIRQVIVETGKQIKSIGKEIESE